MKKFIITITLLFLFPVLKGQTYKIDGTIPQLFDNLQITLLVKDNIGRYTEQTKQALVQKGKFYMKGNIDQPCKRAVIELKKGNKSYKTTFLLDTGTNQITVSVSSDQYGMLRVLHKNYTITQVVQGKIDSIHSVAFMKYRKENNIPDSAFFSLPLQEKHQLTLDKLQLLEHYPNDFISLMILYYLDRDVSMTYYFELTYKSFKKLSSELKSSLLGQKFLNNYQRESLAYQSSQTDSQMIPFKVKDIIDGKEISNESLLGKPYILAFTATWCIPCQESLPQLKALYEYYKDKGLKVVYYYSPSKSDMIKVKEHVQKNNLSWINVFDADKDKYLGARLFVHYVPTYMLIDKAGKIVYNSDKMGEELEGLENYLKKMF